MRETESGASGGLGRRAGAAQGAPQGGAPQQGAGSPSASAQAGAGDGYEQDPAGGGQSQAAEPRTIPTPWRVKWDRFSHGLLPVIVFLLALFLTIFLWRRHTGLSSAVGEVEARQVTVTSTAAGTLVDIGKNKLSKYERVQEGEVIARLEISGELQRRLALRQELEQLRQALSAGGGAETRPAGAAPGPGAAPSAATTGPASANEASLRAAVAGVERELERIESMIQSADIRAPIAGRITQVFFHPGQSVLPGQGIMEIVEEQGTHIITFVRQDTGVRPAAGMPVEVRPRSGTQRTYGSHVVTVGARVELVPEHQLADPKRPEWGLPVRIFLPPATGLRPGELVNLVFKPRGK